MSKKSPKIAALIESCQGKGANPYYLGYFECFNRQLFYEAHDVLEELWLRDKQSPNYAFYKGLIQYAGAFVHLQKNRLRPAAALFKLAQANVAKYPASHEQLDTANLLATIKNWLERLEASDYSLNPLTTDSAPRLHLIEFH
jgi:predicted metal-dependent hydrolase